MRFVHISDLHFNKEGIIDADTFLIPALLKDLIKYNNESNIDHILISGDLIDKGGIGFDKPSDAYDAFIKHIIDPLLRMGISKCNISICPGNHDVVRSLDDSITEAGLKQTLINVETVNKYIDDNVATGRNRVKPYKDFEKSFFADCPNKIIEEYYSVSRNTVNGTNISIVSLNSAWRAYSDNDRGNLILGERQVTSSRKHTDNCAIKVVIMHHPIDWLATFEQKSIANIITKDFDILVCGHVHESDAWSKEGLYGKLFVSVAPSNWSYNLRSDSRLNCNGYSIIDIDESNGSICVHHRKYVHSFEEYRPNTDLGDDAGISYYNIPSSSELTKLQYELNIADKIRKLRYDEINSHLLSYNTETKAPKNIIDIFVKPNLVSKVKIGDELKEEDVSIDDILAADDNTLIFGCKESGKTLLLDEFVLESINKISEYHRTPIYINFDDIGYNQKLETLISHYLAIGMTEFKEYVSNHKLLLLLDNLSLSENKSRQLNKLELLIKQYNIRIIATVTTSVETELPLELAEHETLSNFKLLFLKNFQSKHIKTLINKWFKGNEQFDTPDKLQKIVKMLTALKLPRTPLSISMFLWIIEQQENYKPINHATMLENFIERLFQKQSKKELFHETFDFKNKVRLLSDIAYEMYKARRQNYRLTLAELITYIHSRIVIKKFPFVAEEILDHFLDKGIIVKEIDNSETFVRFRFSCFLQYFLMKRLDYDPEFKSHVLSDENYLHFYNEIDYYTGVYRDKDDILQMLLERIADAYKDIMVKINQIPGTFDAFFEVNTSATSMIDHKCFINNLKEQKKPSDTELESITDKMLEATVPEKGIEIKENKISLLEKLDRLWLLTASVLKNTEETEIDGLKDKAYADVLKYSMAFAAVYKTLLTEYINRPELKLTEELKQKYKLIDKILPLLHQVVLHSTMGSAKLSIVIKDKLISDKTASCSELERFISVFMYADIRAKGYKDEIRQYIKSISAKYIYDMTLIKLISYYHLRSKSKDSDLFYENLIAELITKSKHMKRSDKPQIMSHYKAKKRSKRENEEADE